MLVTDRAQTTIIRENYSRWQAEIMAEKLEAYLHVVNRKELLYEINTLYTVLTNPKAKDVIERITSQDISAYIKPDMNRVNGEKSSIITTFCYHRNILKFTDLIPERFAWINLAFSMISSGAFHSPVIGFPSHENFIRERHINGPVSSKSIKLSIYGSFIKTRSRSSSSKTQLENYPFFLCSGVTVGGDQEFSGIGIFSSPDLKQIQLLLLDRASKAVHSPQFDTPDSFRMSDQNSKFEPLSNSFDKDNFYPYTDVMKRIQFSLEDGNSAEIEQEFAEYLQKNVSIRKPPSEFSCMGEELWWFVLKRDYNKVKKLVEGGADVNFIDPVTKRTAAHVACEAHNFEILDLLLNTKNCNLLVLDDRSNLPFNYLSEHFCLQYLEQVKSLYKRDYFRLYSSLGISQSSFPTQVYDRYLRPIFG